MVTTTSLYDQLTASFQEKALDASAPWLKQLRSGAFESFSKNGFPTVKNEEWRFTNVNAYLKDDYSVQAIPPSTLTALPPIAGLEAYDIVLNNGTLQSDIQIPGVSITDIRKAASDKTLEPYLGKNINLKQNSFAALNTALFQNGIVIEISKNIAVDKPVHIHYVYNAGLPAFMQPRILVIAQPGSTLELIETVSVEGTASLFVNSVTECFVYENARVDQYYLQLAPTNAHFVNFTQVTQKADSLYKNYTYTLPGATLVRNNLHLDLDGTNTESHLYGLYLVGNNQLVDNHTLVNHKKPHCLSNELYKGVLTGNGRGVFNGKIFVQQDAQKTNAFQQNNNMLLSDKAVMDTKPQLEIFADDVKCSHGSTMGSFNADALFYLKARGIGEASARNLLVKAFAFDVTNKIQIPDVRNFVEKLITQKMEEVYEQ